jgi:hypothetical protein
MVFNENEIIKRKMTKLSIWDHALISLGREKSLFIKSGLQEEGRSKMQFISKKALSEITPKIILNFNFVDQIFFSTVVGFMQ